MVREAYSDVAESPNSMLESTPRFSHTSLFPYFPLTSHISNTPSHYFTTVTLLTLLPRYQVY